MRIGPGREGIPRDGAAIVLHPGDCLILDGPVTGPIRVDAQGTETEPVSILPAPGARAELHTSGDGIILVNPRNVRISDIDIIGCDEGEGVLIWADTPGSRNIDISGVSVHGARNGIALGTAVTGGIENATISHCAVEGCQLQGILVWGPEAPGYGLYNITIENCRARGTRGNPALTDNHSGSGIVMGSVDTGAVRSCLAEGNGAGCRASEGPEGIFLYDCRRVAVQHCVAVGNHTGGPADGGGLGIDLRCEECSIEDCEARDNDGAGILLWNLPGMISRNHTIRRNRLIGNCRRTTWHGEITIAPSVSGITVDDNHLEPLSGGRAIRVGVGTRGFSASRNFTPRGSSPDIEFIGVHAHPDSWNSRTDQEEDNT